MGLFALTFLVGVIGYMIVLQCGLIDAVFFAVISFTTVGYGLPEGWSQSAEIFTTFFILGGVAVAYYSLAVLIAALVGGELQGQFAYKKAIRKIQKLRDHTIICGFGRIGRELAESFTAEGNPFLLDMRNEIGIIVIGIKRLGGDLIFNPSGETSIHAGDTLVALGASGQMDKLANLATGDA